MNLREEIIKILIGCIRYSYGHYYGVDQTFADGLTHKELIFVSQRLYDDIDIFKDIAFSNNFKVISILLTANSDSLKARILQRTLDENQRNLRTVQVIEDIEKLAKDKDKLNEKFDLVVTNDDDTTLNSTVSIIWDHIEKELDKSDKHR